MDAIDGGSVPMEMTARERSTGELVMQTRDLTKRYGDLTAVDRLSLSVHRGEIYGFLGPNGAGKTTTLRMLLGLVRPTSGDTTVLGARPGSSEGLSRIGALIEAPGFYPFLSARHNLLVMAGHAGVAAERVDAVLEEVGLAARSKDRFDAYSQGMKQRLGVAAALLKDPEVLILDEPTTGLDPKGMAEMRDFIREQGRAGRTVLLSSHLMPEVEQVCDRAGVIDRGVLVKEGTVDELRGGGVLLVRADPLDLAGRVLHDLPGISEVRSGDGALRIRVDLSRASAVNGALVAAGVAVSELRPERASLEDVFLELTRDDQEVTT
jgi:ABC-type multidrug transport system ATPase subunit